MYQFSRAIYRELAPHVLPPPRGAGARASTTSRCCARARRSSSGWRPTATTSPNPRARCTATSARYFAISEQGNVHRVVNRYIGYAERYLAENPIAAYTAVSGQLPQCRATTRKGSACQRVPLAHNGYCPSHQHLAETEDQELAAA